MRRRRTHWRGELPSGVSTGLTLYNTLGNVMGLASSAREWSSMAKYTLTSDLTHNLDSLREVHDLLVEKIQLVPAEWRATCDNCTDDELEAAYTIERSWDSMRSVAGMATDWISESVDQESDDCPLRLKKLVAKMRLTLTILDAECDNLVGQLAATTERRVGDYVHYGNRACDQEHQSTTRDEDETAFYDEDGTAFYDPHEDVGLWSDLTAFYDPAGASGVCRELPTTMPREQVIEACKQQCHAMDECKGFTLYNGTVAEFGPRRAELDSWSPFLNAEERSGAYDMEVGDEVGIFKNGAYLTFKSCENLPMTLAPARKSCDKFGRLGVECGPKLVGCWKRENLHLLRKRTGARTFSNQCCFTTSVLEADTQGSAECYVRLPGNSLRSMSSDDAAAWFSFLPTGGSEALSEVFAEAAEQVRSRDLNGLALQAMGSHQLQEHLGIVDPGQVELLQCMIDASRTGSSESVCLAPGFLKEYQRLRGIVDPYVFFGVKADLSSKAWVASALSRIGKTVKSYLRQNAWLVEAPMKMIDLTMDVYFTHGSAVALAAQDFTGGVDWLAVASSVSFLLNKAADVAWGQCPVVEAWLSNTDISDPEKMDQFVDSLLASKSS